MKPTNELRFVERVTEVMQPGLPEGYRANVTQRILQQRWEYFDAATGKGCSEWREVPLEPAP